MDIDHSNRKLMKRLSYSHRFYIVYYDWQSQQGKKTILSENDFTF